MPQHTITRRLSRRRGVSLDNLDWPILVGLAILHLGCLLAPFYFSWSGLILAGILYWLSGAIGIALCYHRLLTHRSFKTPKWFEYILTGLGCLAWQGGPAQWVGTHRLHHKHSDEELDPHSPNHGFTWSHVLWAMHKLSEGRQGADAARDLQRDCGMRVLNRYYWIVPIVTAAMLFLGGEWASHLGLNTSGLSWVLWAVCVRTVVLYHNTWFVNSAAHTWGYRNYDTKDRSANLWWVALLSFGEGWHNNHHADQRAAGYGHRWLEIDLTYWTIRLLGCVGLARDINHPRPVG